MIGYLCATPFHITAAITMQSGQFAGEPSTLIILNHFNVDDTLLGPDAQRGFVLFENLNQFHGGSPM